MQELLQIVADPTLTHIHDKVIISFSIIVLRSILNLVPCLSQVGRLRGTIHDSGAHARRF